MAASLSFFLDFFMGLGKRSKCPWGPTHAIWTFSITSSRSSFSPWTCLARSHGNIPWASSGGLVQLISLPVADSTLMLFLGQHLGQPWEGGAKGGLPSARAPFHGIWARGCFHTWGKDGWAVASVCLKPHLKYWGFINNWYGVHVFCSLGSVVEYKMSCKKQLWVSNLFKLGFQDLMLMLVYDVLIPLIDQLSIDLSYWTDAALHPESVKWNGLKTVKWNGRWRLGKLKPCYWDSIQPQATHRVIWHLLDWEQMGLCSSFCLSEGVLGVVTRALLLHPISICSHWYNSCTEGIVLVPTGSVELALARNWERIFATSKKVATLPHTWNVALMKVGKTCLATVWRPRGFWNIGLL